MMTGGIGVRAYTIEDNRILFVCDQRGHKDMNRVRSFLLQQAETEEFEWNSKKSRPGDGVADADAGGDAAPADPLARFQAMQDEQADEEKRRARAEKKKKEERKRKQRRQREMAEKKKRIAAEKKAKLAKEAADKQQQQQQQQESASLKTEL